MNSKLFSDHPKANYIIVEKASKEQHKPAGG